MPSQVAWLVEHRRRRASRTPRAVRIALATSRHGRLSRCVFGVSSVLLRGPSSSSFTSAPWNARAGTHTNIHTHRENRSAPRQHKIGLVQRARRPVDPTSGVRSVCVKSSRFSSDKRNPGNRERRFSARSQARWRGNQRERGNARTPSIPVNRRANGDTVAPYRRHLRRVTTVHSCSRYANLETHGRKKKRWRTW